MAFSCWSEWMKEGHFYSFEDQQKVRNYFFVLSREWAHYVYDWPETIAPAAFNGPHTVTDLETTKENQIWQVIFGIKPNAYIYTFVPEDIARHGVAKRPTPTNALWEVGHYRMQDSPFDRPSFITELFLIKPHVPYMAVKAYNPENITFRTAYNPLKLNFYVAKCQIEWIGDEAKGETIAAESRYVETLDKLHRRVIPHRPLTLWPIRAPPKGV